MKVENGIGIALVGLLRKEKDHAVTYEKCYIWSVGEDWNFQEKIVLQSDALLTCCSLKCQHYSASKLMCHDVIEYKVFMYLFLVGEFICLHI